jgi:mRNA deadenylase 3'-5' endonuclease subunit Ccr4
MRKTFRQLTDVEKEQITVEFHLKTLEAMSKKFNVSKSTIQQVVTNFFKDKRIDVTGLSVTEIMDKYNVTMGKAITLRMKFDKPLGGSVYFGQTKEAIYSNEDEMLVPSYSVKDLKGWEASMV